jgi:N-acetylglucosamine-6-phosphate deacetylase
VGELMYALINGEIYTGEGIVKNKAIIIDGNRVEALVDEIPKDIQVIDLQGKIVAPAFIDLQLNGCGGVLFNDEISLDTLRIMNETNIKTGTTSYLPTLITTTDENIEKALKLVEENENLEEIGILGLHIEGPYISIPKKGIHNPAYIRVMSDEIIHKIAKFGSRVTKIMTIAPENAKS